jgi:hypothetical protein
MAERMNTQQSSTQYCVNHRREQRLLSIALGERCESMADSRSLSSETGLTRGPLRNRRMPNLGIH